MYDVNTGQYKSHRINREDMDTLKRAGCMAVEGIIKDDDLVWR